MTALGKSPLAGLAALGLSGLAPANTGGLNPAGKTINISYRKLCAREFHIADVFQTCLYICFALLHRDLYVCSFRCDHVGKYELFDLLQH